jgi:hypothetical protein
MTTYCSDHLTGREASQQITHKVARDPHLLSDLHGPDFSVEAGAALSHEQRLVIFAAHLP